MERWPVRFVLASGDRSAAHEVSHRLECAERRVGGEKGSRGRRNRVVREIRRCGLAGLALYRLEQAGIPPGAGVDSLRRQAMKDVGPVAARKVALQLLDSFCAEHDVRPILLKGSVTGPLYYPKESLRLSSDVDCLIPSGAGPLFSDQELRFDEHHLPAGTLGLMRVEYHVRLTIEPRWGEYDGMVGRARPCPPFRMLLRPDMGGMITYILLHFTYHGGTMPFDLVDLGFILERETVDWPELAAAWRRDGLLPYVMPALIWAEPVTGRMPPGLVAELWSGLLPGQWRGARVAHEIVRGRLRSFIFREYAYCRFGGRSFGRFCRDHFFGSPERTEMLSGWKKPSPLFWWHHLVVCPLRRLGYLFRKKSE